jgi:hypothetical protein
VKPGLNAALQEHFAAIANRDIEASTNPEETIELHRRWRIVHDRNTACDFVAFARMAGIPVT